MTKLIAYWQRNNLPLSDDAARTILGVKNLAQRVADLRHKSGVVILDRWDSTKKFKLYHLGCQCETPRIDVTGCYLHDPKLKVV